MIKPTEPNESEEISGQLPFILPPASIPCQICCVNYDRGGEGVAYHRTDDKIYELYRKDSVEIEPSDDTGAGQNIKNLKESEWLEYTINLGAVSLYDGEQVMRISVRSGSLRLNWLEILVFRRKNVYNGKRD